MNARSTPVLLASLLVSLFALGTAGCGQAGGGSLTDSRLAVIHGRAPGKVLIEAPATPASGAASGAASTAARSPVLPPPSGRSLQEARRLDAPDQGIRLPTAREAAASEPARR